MQDNELFELCKEVYRRLPEWETRANYYMTIGGKSTIWHWQDAQEFDRSERFPLYTSDYLLEKLPAKLAYNKTEYFYYLEKFDDGSYGSGYGFTDEGGHIDHPMIGVLTDNVALKVNLKLVIALDDAGQLVAAETTA
ncbi:hypothetical protein [Rhodococcus sp. YH3-3]|uniref:hypothetical protein n=1 Tax=Rhodococcus sp. YH3-3 TaxID=1803579 RepID=UPI0007DB2309|nr:hypothetical protein [Rhodococcus sp. YH3-3]